MLIISIALCIAVVWLAFEHVRVQRLMQRMERLEKERNMWKLAAEVYSEEAQRKSLDAIS